LPTVSGTVHLMLAHTMQSGTLVPYRHPPEVCRVALHHHFHLGPRAGHVSSHACHSIRLHGPAAHTVDGSGAQMFTGLTIRPLVSISRPEPQAEGGLTPASFALRVCGGGGRGEPFPGIRMSDISGEGSHQRGVNVGTSGEPMVRHSSDTRIRHRAVLWET
jgi:hypothetical protein